MATKKQEAVKPAGKVNETKAETPTKSTLQKGAQPKEKDPDTPAPEPKKTAKSKLLDAAATDVAAVPATEKKLTTKKTNAPKEETKPEPMTKDKAGKNEIANEKIETPAANEVPNVATEKPARKAKVVAENVLEEEKTEPLVKEKQTKKTKVSTEVDEAMPIAEKSPKKVAPSEVPIEEIAKAEEPKKGSARGEGKAASDKPKASKKDTHPVKKILSESSLDKRVLAAKASAGIPPRPTPTPAARPVEKKPQVIIAHRRLENKSRQTEETEAVPTYQPEVYRSILDELPVAPITVYRYPDEDLQEFRELILSRLEAARKELAYLQGVITRKDEAGTEDTENRYMNVEDGSGAMEREQLAQLAGRQIQFVNHLEKALIRIENKTYGICRVTGKLIEKARLRAVPHATLSIEAKKLMNTKQN